MLQVDDCDPCTDEEFAELNEDDPWIVEQVLALKVGESVTFGGGAMAEAVVTRLS